MKINKNHGSDNMNRIVPPLRFPEFENDGDWETETINDLSKTVTAGGTPSTNIEDYWGGDIRWMNSGELNLKIVEEVEGRITKEGLKNSSTKIIPKNSVLIGLAGQGKTRGTVAINKVKLCTNQSIASIYPNEDVFDSEFLYHNLDNRYNELRELSAGGEGRGGLNLKIIREIRIPIPPKKEEQEKIAACLSSLDDVITAETEKLDLLQDHKKGLLQQLFPNRLNHDSQGFRDGHDFESDNKSRNQANQKNQGSDNVPRFRFPEFIKDGDWDETTLGECLDYLQPTPYLVSSTDYDDKYETPVLTAGKTFILGYTDEMEGIFNENLPVIIFDDFTTASKFVDFPFKAKSSAMKILLAKGANDIKFMFEAIQNIKFEVKTHQRHWISVYSNLEILKPKDPKEQQKIADCLSVADELIEAQAQKVEILQEHKKGLLQQLFPQSSTNY